MQFSPEYSIKNFSVCAGVQSETSNNAVFLILLQYFSSGSISGNRSDSSLLLPSEEGADRINLLLTTFLAILVFVLVVLEIVPEESDTLPMFCECLCRVLQTFQSCLTFFGA